MLFTSASPLVPLLPLPCMNAMTAVALSLEHLWQERKAGEEGRRSAIVPRMLSAAACLSALHLILSISFLILSSSHLDCANHR